jgi:hypothetical protein
MPTEQILKYLIYALAIILSMIAAALAAVSPAQFTDIKNAYQQF